jgi:hypothetical protein
MINAIYAFIWLGILFKWGDWKNWRRYYPTILFFIIGDFLYLYLLSDHYPMWRYSPPEADQEVGLTNTHISLSIIAIKYPATVLAYLSNFPEKNLMKKVLYFTGWIVFYLLIEMMDRHFHLIEYFNGWSIWWSALFNSVMFFILWVHFKNPFIAWLLSIGFIFFLWNQFDVPSKVFR